MASKIINGTTNNTNISARMVCSSTPNVAGNYSLVSVSGRLSRTNSGYTTSGNGTFYLDINGKTYSATGYYEITQNSDTVMVSANNIRVDHNADGKKTINVAFRGSLPDTSLSSISCSGTFPLDDIPRASSVTVPASVNAGTAFTITLSRAVSTFTHDIALKFGTRTMNYTGVATSQSVTIPLAWLDQIPNADSGALTITVTTKSGSTVIGTTTKTVTIKAPNSVVPTVSIKSMVAQAQVWSKYIQGKSKVKIELTAAGVYGSSIVRYSIQGGGYDGNTNPYTTGPLLLDGTYGFTCTVYDSRGRSATVNSANITVQSYAPPSFQDIVCDRSNGGGTADSNGTYVNVKALVVYSSCGGSNSIAIKVAYRVKDTGSWSSDAALTNNTAKVIGAGAISISDYYEVRFRVTDGITTSPIEYIAIVPTAKFAMVWGKDRIGFLGRAGGPGVWLPEVDSSTPVYLGDKKIDQVLAKAAHKHSVADLTGITDRIVAQGSDSNWIYWAKWENGLAICISTAKQNGNFPSEAWGSLYRGLSIAGIAYPFTFSSTPCSFFTRVTADTNAFHETTTWCAPWGGNGVISPSVILLRPTNTTIGHPYIRCVSIGKWT